MKVKVIPSRWLSDPGTRLAARPHHSGARDALDVLSRMSTTPLRELTEGGVRGIFNGPRFARQYVEDPQFGVPLLSGADILATDLSRASLIARRQATSMPEMLLKRGTTLVTSYGTVGRTAYVRADMQGMVGSDNVMKVVPAQSFTIPGYLFAFLSSKYGVPITTVGTTGGTVPFLPPERLFDLPVPQLGDDIEQEVHDRIDGAGSARALAAQHKREAKMLLLDRLGLDDISSTGTPTSFAAFIVDSSGLSRLDAAFHSPACRTAAAQLAAAAPGSQALSDVARVFTPGIFKRRYVDAPEYGYPYFSGTELFQLDAAPRGHLAKKWPGIEEYRVSTGWLLIQDAGQLGGLIGSVARVPPHFDGSVVSNHLMRIAVEDRTDAAFLFALLTSAHGYRAIVRNAFGSSIPQLDPKHIGQLMMPWPDQSVRAEVADMVLRAWKLEDGAVADERQGVALVERAIEEAA